MRVGIHARLDQRLLIEIRGLAGNGVEIERNIGRPGQNELGQVLAHAGRDRQPADDTAISQPVLSVLGTETEQRFVDGRDLLNCWFPRSWTARSMASPIYGTCSVQSPCRKAWMSSLVATPWLEVGPRRGAVTSEAPGKPEICGASLLPSLTRFAVPDRTPGGLDRSGAEA
jgi:hypothetical protein